jgi:transcriptional regulator with XRE-family HTH domain
MDTEPAEVIDQRVAARIRARRLDMGLTLQSLAQEIGVAFQQAHKYERGLSRISAGRLYNVARALKAPVGFFFAAEGGAGAADRDAAEAAPAAARGGSGPADRIRKAG